MVSAFLIFSLSDAPSSGMNGNGPKASAFSGIHHAA